MKTAISIPDPVFREVERTAKRLGLSRSEFFTRAAQRLMATLRDAEITASYDAAFGAPDENARFRRTAAEAVLRGTEWSEE